MPTEPELSAVLSEFARTLITDFPIQGILDRLVERIVDVLPITAAGVTLISAGADPHYIAASNDSALLFEQLQSELGEGPCVLAYQEGEAVSVIDVRTEPRFPAFVPRALSAGLGAVFTFPLRSGDSRLGALDLYRDQPGPLTPDSMVAAQTLADVAAAYLLNAQIRADLLASSARARDSSLHDALTGLPNRALLLERLQHSFRRSRRTANISAVLFADLDDFKAVNDQHGHRTGDDLLVAVARRLEAFLRPGDTLARLSGDEFVILCEDLSTESEVDAIASRLGAALGAPFLLSCGAVSVTASIGIAFAAQAHLDLRLGSDAGFGDNRAERILDEADKAMYEAKRSGGARYRTASPGSLAPAWGRLDPAQDLLSACRNGELWLDYQPIVDTRSRRIVGAEALLRWPSPSDGPIAPEAMLPLASVSDPLGEIGRSVLLLACQDRHLWTEVTPSCQLFLAVDVSPAQLMAPGFTAMIDDVLTLTGTDASLLTLHFTEAVLLRDPSRAQVVLSDLKDLGVMLAVDNFGAGTISVTHLRTFPIDGLQLDRSIVRSIGRDRGGEAIVAALTELSHALGLRVTAKGVEEATEYHGVVASGCDTCQGSYLAPPASAAVIAERLRHRMPESAA